MEDIIAVRSRTSAEHVQDRSEKSRTAGSSGSNGETTVNAGPLRSARLRRLRNACFDPQTRRAMIAEAAYVRAERRGFAPGGELEDWLAAEMEFEHLFEGEHFCGD